MDVKKDKCLAGQLLECRPAHSETTAAMITGLMWMSILLRIGFIVYAHFFVESWWEEHLNVSANKTVFGVSEMDSKILWGSQIEMGFSVLFFWRMARWEDQGHLVTLWQTMYTLEVLVSRQPLYNDVILLSIAFIGLYLTYLVGIYTEFTKRERIRLPPFPYKKRDTEKPRYGWLGQRISRTITGKYPRMFVTLILYCAGLAFSFFTLYAFLVSEVDDLRNLPTYKNQTLPNNQALTPLMIVAILASLVSMIPTLIVESGAIPGLLYDLRTYKKSSRGYKTGVWDVCELDEDKDGPGSDLTQKMKQAGKLLGTTIVLPCYLPNEQEILPMVWQHYLKEFGRLAEYEQKVFGPENPCEKRILVVWNSPDKHPDFSPLVQEWSAKFKANGFSLDVHENPHSTSKCDNLNMACSKDDPLIRTDCCCLNDADTMLDWSCIVRGNLHLQNGCDMAQAMNSHCLYDRNGTPGDENERQCHPYGILITIGDSTKPQNMSTQTPFKHAPFNGRGGFWKTEAVQLVGFDHRTVGEDHDAGYRACAYFGKKGILDMNMLCQEQEPPDCKSLTSQRIRWETAALEMRRTFSWILRSPHYSNYEIFVLLWGQLAQNCNLPFQSTSFSVATAIPLIILKGWLSIYGFGDDTDLNFCSERDCIWSFHVKNPLNGNRLILALPMPLVIFILFGLFYCLVNAFDFGIRVLGTRYRPRCMFFVYYGLLKSMFVVPFFVYVQYWALFDYCWGGAKFIATSRSPVSPKKEEVGGLEKPLLR